jgi:hypothetical protein
MKVKRTVTVLLCLSSRRGSKRFGELGMAGFPGAGSYMGARASIGL